MPTEDRRRHGLPIGGRSDSPAPDQVPRELQRARVTVAAACLFALVLAAIVVAVVLSFRGPPAARSTAAQPPDDRLGTTGSPPGLAGPQVPVSMRPESGGATRAGPGLTVGAVIGLELRDRPGYRIRQLDFLARIDPIGPNSRPEDRADARFTVRQSDVAGCVSLESVPLPGYFLHHRNFVIHLDRADGSDMFPADSTFCPVTVARGAFVLRSSDFPTRYVTEHDDALDLTEASPAAAVALEVRPPI